MPGWSLKNSGDGSTSDWFLDRLATARSLVPDAEFDTVIRMEFDEGITTEIVDVVGTASADPADAFSGGVITLSVGDPVIAPNAARVQKTGAGAHVATQQTPWYFASLVKFTQPLDAAQLPFTDADMIGIWTDIDTRVVLGIHGSGSGGNITNWIGRVVNNGGGTSSQVTGPALDGEESPVWHFFEGYNDGTDIHFAIDGAEFLTTIATAGAAAQPAMLSMYTERSAAGDPALVNYEKACLVVASPAPGSI